jgi:predicted RND superfamily exporter protein
MAICLCVIAITISLVVAFVDMKPQITPEFFFGSSDPDLAQTTQIKEMFPSDEFLVISVASQNILSPGYYDRIRNFSSALLKIKGVGRLVSVTEGPDSVQDALESPFWRPLIISEDGNATLVIAFVHQALPENTIFEIEAAARLFNDDRSFRIQLSGMPYIVEQIRRSLVHDVTIFSALAIGVFTVLLAGIFRSPMAALGGGVSGVMAVLLTLLAQHVLGQPIGILTPNLIIIVYVLVQSQIIYLTSNWQKQKEKQGESAVRGAVSYTIRASFWCMVTTLLGFATLPFVSAEPLRQLGVGGMTGVLMAFLCSFLLHPVFLLFAKRRPINGQITSGTRTGTGGFFRHSMGIILIAVSLAALPGLLRLNADPSLLSYFKKDSDLHSGLGFVDRNGGSSPMELVVRLKDQERLDTEAGYNAMWNLHKALLSHKDVGTVISLPALMAEANNHPLSFLLPWREIVSLLSLDMNQRIANSFLSADRDQTLFLLRMREEGRQQQRNLIVADLQGLVQAEGFETVLTGGVYVLQGRLSDLVTTSLLTGLLGLLVLFGVVAAIVSRHAALTVAMIVTGSMIPVVILGGGGWLAVPIDIISAPAATVCFGIGVDALIHTAMAVKRRLSEYDLMAALSGALQEQSQGVMLSTGIIALGYAVFAFSEFPPTVRFGGAIVIGALFAGMSTLTVFPLLSRVLDRTKRVQ